LIDVETVVNLISNTTTKTGLSVICERDNNIYPLKQIVSDDDFEAINIRKILPFGDWNYIIFLIFCVQLIFALFLSTLKKYIKIYIA